MENGDELTAPNEKNLQPLGPQNTTPVSQFEVKPAGAWSRYWAGVIDGMIYGLPAIVLAFLMARISGQKLTLSTIEQNQVFTVFILAFQFCYYVYLTTAKGTTIGKDAYGLTVVKFGTNQRLTYVQSAIREGVKTILLLIPLLGGVFYFINALVVILSKQKRGIHDIVAGSHVLKIKPPWKIKKQLLFFGGYVLLLGVLFFAWIKIDEFLPSVSSVSIEKPKYQLFTNVRDSWKIEYDASIFNPPFPSEPIGGRKLGNNSFHTFINRKSNVSSFCYESISVLTRTNLSPADIENNKNFYVNTVNEVKPVTINGLNGYRILSKTSQVAPQPYMVNYLFASADKDYRIMYLIPEKGKFPEKLCIENELLVEKMIYTFQLL